MFLWFLGLSWWGVWGVFRSPAVDYRVVMAGSVLPLVESVLGGSGPAHSLVAPIVALTVVMGVTVGSRLRRRRWLGLPIGWFAHLVLDGVWAEPDRFWWPLGGGPWWTRGAVEGGRGVWAVVMELTGAAVLLWCWGRFRLDEAEHRREFLRTGQVNRGVARGT